ncbi:MAG: quaternary amine ABC transporter ATP-binding protein [Bacillota bacterium]
MDNKDKSKIIVKDLYKIFGKTPGQAIDMIEQGLSKDEILDKTGNTVGVQEANFEIKEGEIFVIMGLSGSGKSTLLRCINRLMEPTRGEVIVDGINVTDLDKNELRKLREDKFGMVFQHFALLPYRTVLENTKFGLEIQNIPQSQQEERAIEALKKVGLEGYENQYPDQLSGGMKQRVGLARALAVDPDIFIMDEPFSALDPLIKTEMQDRLLELYEEVKKTIVFITHDLDEALKLGDRIAIMKDGEIVQIGNHEEILTDAKNEYVREFVKNVNRSRVLTAEDIMVKPVATLYPEEGEGPRTAMHKMRQNEISSISVVGQNRDFQGILKIEKTLEAINNDIEDVTELIDKDVPVASPEDNIDELFSKIAGVDTPLPVLNEDNKLLGIIIKSSVISNLTAEEVL